MAKLTLWNKINREWFEKDSRLSQTTWVTLIERGEVVGKVMAGVPFIDEDFLTFMLSLPNKFRNKQKLYNKMLLKAFPELFKMPTKVNLGLGLDANLISYVYKKIKTKLYNNQSYINYIDFNSNIKEPFRLKAFSTNLL